MFPKVIAAFVALNLSMCPALAQYRTALTGAVTYFYQTTGDDSANDCLSTETPCKTCTGAAKKASRLDLMGYEVTIQHVDEGAPVVIDVNCWIPTMVGGGTLRILGSATVGNTILHAKDPATGQCVDNITLFDTHISVFVDQMTLLCGGSGQISVDYVSRLYIGSSMYFGEGRVDGNGVHNNSHIYVHDSQAQAYIFTAPKVVGSASSFIFINKGQVFVEYATIQFVNFPTFYALYSISNNGNLQHVNNFYSGAVTGKKFMLMAGGSLNGYGSPINITGASDGDATDGHYKP